MSKPAYKIKLTKKQAKTMKKGCRPIRVYAVMNDGEIFDVTLTPTRLLEEKNPYTFKITLSDDK